MNQKRSENKRKGNEIVFRYGELFCGPGGLALGAIRAAIEHDGLLYRIEHSWANDYDKDSCDTYARNISPQKPESVIYSDVKELDYRSLPEIDAFAFGFPCNDFSIVGEQKGFEGKYGPLYTYGVKVINHFKPRFFVAENVGGLKSANEGKTFFKILNDLENSGDGYVLTPHLYKFEEYGVPQKRHRIIIVGIARGLGLRFKIPAPITKGMPLTVRDALTVPPIPHDAPNNELTAQSSRVIERLKHIRPGENVWTANLPRHLVLNVKNARMSQIYKRLYPDEPAYTVTGSGGGGTHIYHWEENRSLTNRERARLQTFPDDFVFIGKKESTRKQIGMAVPPKASEMIFTAILSLLAGKDYEHIDANMSGIQTEFIKDEMMPVKIST